MSTHIILFWLSPRVCVECVKSNNNHRAITYCGSKCTVAVVQESQSTLETALVVTCVTVLEQAAHKRMPTALKDHGWLICVHVEIRWNFEQCSIVFKLVVEKDSNYLTASRKHILFLFLFLFSAPPFSQFVCQQFDPVSQQFVKYFQKLMWQNVLWKVSNGDLVSMCVNPREQISSILHYLIVVNTKPESSFPNLNQSESNIRNKNLLPKHLNPSCHPSSSLSSPLFLQCCQGINLTPDWIRNGIFHSVIETWCRHKRVVLRVRKAI